jgi:hypothetical protein
VTTIQALFTNVAGKDVVLTVTVFPDSDIEVMLVSCCV